MKRTFEVKELDNGLIEVRKNGKRIRRTDVKIETVNELIELLTE